MPSYLAAIWFAKLGVNARIIDKRDTRIFTGQADGLQPRALEVFNSFGFAHRPLKEASIGFGASLPFLLLAKKENVEFIGVILTAP